MSGELRQWAVVENGVVIQPGFDAPQEYVDTYTDQVVDRSDRTTPTWYHEGIEFLDVTGLDPRPQTGWYKSGNGRWVNGSPSLTTTLEKVPADGTTAAVVTFAQKGPAAPAQVTFDVNGTETIVPLVNGAAAVEVVSSTPGDVVTVTVGDLSVNIVTEA